MAEMETVHPPPNRPTIIRAKNQTDGPGPPVPSRPTPPGRPSQPPSASDPTQPSADNPVNQAAAVSRPTPPVPQRPGAPPSQHKDASSPANLSSSSVQPSPTTSVKKRPEITVVSARPMSEVGFRDVKNEPLSKSDAPIQSALNSSDQNTSLSMKSATEDGNLNKPVVISRNLPSSKIADKTPKSRGAPPQIPTRTSTPTGTSVVDDLPDLTLNAKLEEPSASMPVKDKPLRPTIIRPARPIPASSAPSKDSSNNGPQLDSSQPPCPKPRQRRVNESSNQSSGTTDLTLFGETEETSTKSPVRVLPAVPAAVKLKPTVIPKLEPEKNTGPEEQGNSLESKSLESDVKGPPPPLGAKPKPTVLPKPKPSDKPQNENSVTSKTLEDIETEVKFCEINSLPESSLDPKNSSSVNSFKRPTIIRPPRQQGAQEQTRGLNTTNDSSSKTVSKEENDSDSLGEYVHLRPRQDSGQPVPSPRPVTVAVSPSEQKKANQSFFSESGTSRDDSEVLRPQSKPQPISRTRRATIAVTHNLPPSPPSQPLEDGRISVTTKDIKSSGNYGNAPLKPPRMGEKPPPHLSHSPDVSHDQQSETKPSDGKVALSQARHQPNRPGPIGRPPPPTLRSEPQGDAAKGKSDAEVKEPIHRPPPPRIPLPPTPKGEKPSETHDGNRDDSDELPGYAIVDKPAPKRPQPPTGHSEVSKEEMPGSVDKIPEYAVIQKKNPHRPHSSHGSLESNQFSEGKYKDEDVHVSKESSETASRPLPTVSRPPPPIIKPACSSPSDIDDLTHGTKPAKPGSRPPPPKIFQQAEESPEIEKKPTGPKDAPRRPVFTPRKSEPTFRQEPQKLSASKSPQGVRDIDRPLPTRPGPGHPLYHYMSTQPHGVASFDYTALQPDELSFQVGDIILLTKQIDSNWMLGKNGSQEGLFPSSFIEIKVPLGWQPKVPVESDSDSEEEYFDATAEKPDLIGHGPRCRARFDYEGGEDEDLVFEEGDVIKLLEKIDEEWFKGEVHGKVGMFPASFVEIIKDLPGEGEVVDVVYEAEGATSHPGHMTTALYTYTGEVGDLSFKEGDKIKVLGFVQKGWLVGEARGKRGKFPANFIDAEFEIPPYDEKEDIGYQDNKKSSVKKRPSEKKTSVKENPIQSSQKTYGAEDEIEGMAGEGEVVDIVYEAEGATSHPGHMTTAVFGYSGGVGELTFKEGDKIKVLGFVQKGWLVGEARGKRGKFPANFIDAEFEIPPYDEKEDTGYQDNKKSSVKKRPSEKKTLEKESPIQSPRKTHEAEDEIEGMAGEGEVVDIVYEAEGATSHPGHMTTAVFGYSGGVGELTFKEGDRIKVLGFVKKGWLVGEARGKRGKFPANFIDAEFEIPPYEEEAELNLHTSDHGKKKTSVKKSTVQQSPQKTVALYDFEGQTDQDLTFKEGDVIEILENVDDQWLRGRVHGREGIFPANFVNLSQSNGAFKADTESKKDVIGEALFDFVGEAVNELTFKAGDKIVLLEKVEDSSGWQWGMLNGKKGMFPVNFVKSA